jgi:hypothetical protein
MKKTAILILTLLFCLNANAEKYYIKITEKHTSIKQEVYRNWELSSSLFTGWVNVGLPYDYTLFEPLITNQLTDFTQTQKYSQNRENNEQKREFDTIDKIYKNIGELTTIYGTIEEENTRTINVVDNGWVNVGVSSDCGEWSPLPIDINKDQIFTQSRECQQEKNKSLNYYIDLELEDTKTINQTVADTQTQQNTGIKVVKTWKRTATYNIYTTQSYSDYYDSIENFPEPVWIQPYQKNTNCSTLNEKKYFKLSDKERNLWSSTWYSYPLGKYINEEGWSYSYGTEIWTCLE